jgi:2-polyprenyl-6-methoxyphenol hydroxylase-like FAD-dependent oxidoreductase
MIGAGLRMLVVGAGIGGLGAARALRQRGFAADVLEREPDWAHSGADIYLPGNAARALRTLGLESAVAERASPISHQRLCDHRGRLLADIDLAALPRSASSPSAPTRSGQWGRSPGASSPSARRR